MHFRKHRRLWHRCSLSGIPMCHKNTPFYRPLLSVCMSVSKVHILFLKVMHCVSILTAKLLSGGAEGEVENSQNCADFWAAKLEGTEKCDFILRKWNFSIFRGVLRKSAGFFDEILEKSIITVNRLKRRFFNYFRAIPRKSHPKSHWKVKQKFTVDRTFKNSFLIPLFKLDIHL